MADDLEEFVLLGQMAGGVGKGARAGQAAVAGALGGVEMLVGAAKLAHLACVGMALPLLRRRMGPRAALTSGLFGVAGVWAVGAWFKNHPLVWLIVVWWVALLLATLVHVACGVWRMFRPPAGSHIPSDSLGIACVPLDWVWVRLLGRRGRGAWVEAAAEPCLLGALGGVLYVAEWIVSAPGAGGVGFSGGLWLVPVLCGAGCGLFALIRIWKRASERQTLRDQASAQAGLAEVVNSDPVESERPIEGVAQIGPRQ